MTAATAMQTSLDDILAEQKAVLYLVASDPANQRSVDAVIEAIRQAAKAHDGVVSRNTVAPLLPPWVAPKVIGATFSGLVARHKLVFKGWEESTDSKGRNAGKPCRRYRVIGLDAA